MGHVRGYACRLCNLDPSRFIPVREEPASGDLEHIKASRRGFEPGLNARSHRVIDCGEAPRYAPSAAPRQALRRTRRVRHARHTRSDWRSSRPTPTDHTCREKLVEALVGDHGLLAEYGQVIPPPVRPSFHRRGVPGVAAGGGRTAGCLRDGPATGNRSTALIVAVIVVHDACLLYPAPLRNLLAPLALMCMIQTRRAHQIRHGSTGRPLCDQPGEDTTRCPGGSARSSLVIDFEGEARS